MTLHYEILLNGERVSERYILPTGQLMASIRFRPVTKIFFSIKDVDIQTGGVTAYFVERTDRGETVDVNASMLGARVALVDQDQYIRLNRETRDGNIYQAMITHIPDSTEEE